MPRQGYGYVNIPPEINKGYEELLKEINAENGGNLKMAQLIDQAMTFFKRYRKLPTTLLDGGVDDQAD